MGIGRRSQGVEGVGPVDGVVPEDISARASRVLGARNLVLVGFMGVGKTRVGRLVASLLHRPFTDTDALIARRAAMSIPDLFAQIGEEGFRDLESQVVAEVTRHGGQVVATGGGTLGRAENLERLRASGLLVALDARSDVILARVGGAQAGRERPLLRTEDPLRTITQLQEKRATLYQAADLHLDTSEQDVVEVASTLVFRLADLDDHRREGEA